MADCKLWSQEREHKRKVHAPDRQHCLYRTGQRHAANPSKQAFIFQIRVILCHQDRFVFIFVFNSILLKKSKKPQRWGEDSQRPAYHPVACHSGVNKTMCRYVVERWGEREVV